MVVQIKSLFPAITSKFFDVLSPHPCPEEVSTEPVPATVRAEMVLKSFRDRIVQSHAPGSFDHKVIDLIC
jgi:hypothetical protein